MLTAAMVPHAHFFATPVLVFHCLYALGQMRLGLRIPVGQVVLVACGVAILVLPLAPSFLDLSDKSTSLAVGTSRGARDIVGQFAPLPLLFAGLVGLIVGFFVCGSVRMRSLDIPAPTRLLVCGLFLIPNILFLALSLLTPVRIFVPRYLIITNVAQALLVGWGVALLRPAKLRMIITLSLLICSVAGMGQWDHFWPSHTRDDWRGAITAIRKSTENRPVPVVFTVPFIESLTTRARPELSSITPGFFLSPLSVYPVSGHVIPVAVGLDDVSRSYLKSRVVPQVNATPSFILITWLSPNPYDNWFRRLPGYMYRGLGDFGNVNVTVFDRIQSPASCSCRSGG